jgi:DNA polymerase-3 subunit alpha
LHADTQQQPAKLSQADPTKAFSQAEMLQYEKELVGFYITGHPLDAFAGLAEAVNSHREEVLPSLPDRTDFRLCGVASGITKRLSKRDNQPWAFFNLATRNGTIQINCYSDAFAEYGALLENERALAITGSVLNRDGDIRYSAREIQPLARALPDLIKKITWILRPEAEADAFLRELREVLDRQSGPTHIAIGFLEEDDFIALAEVSQFLRWRVEPAEFKRLRAHPAVVGCLIDTKGIPPAAPRRWGKRNGGGNGE